MAMGLCAIERCPAVFLGQQRKTVLADGADGHLFVSRAESASFRAGCDVKVRRRGGGESLEREGGGRLMDNRDCERSGNIVVTWRPHASSSRADGT